MTKRPILGIDSETRNDETGMAYCTLIACSDGTHIQDDDIRTNQALHYVTRRRGELWTFFGDYDYNFWLRDFHRNALDRLRRTGWAKSGRWRVHHIPRRLFEVWDLQSDHFVRVYDAFPFIQRSFVAWLESWSLCDKRTIERIAAMKRQRSQFSRLSADSILRYTQDEVRLIARGVEALKDRVGDAGLAPSMWMGPGSVAAHAMRKAGVKGSLPSMRQSRSYRRIAERAYYGGRIETSAVGMLKGPLYQYDIVSAYPAACTTLPCLRHGKWIRTKHPSGPTLCYVRWRPRAPGTVWGPFPVRPQPGVPLRYYATGKGWYWWDEVKPWVKSPTIVLDIGTCWKWRQTCKHRPFAWVQELFAKRAALKAAGDPGEYALKLVLNSVYGKLAQRVGRAPFYCPEWAGLITARTRGRLGEILANGAQSVRVVATDGLLASRPLLGRGRGRRLGAWGLEATYKYADIWQPGFYILSDGKVRTRGYSRVEVDDKALRSAWQSTLFHGAAKVKKSYVVGYRLATAQNRMQDLCRWVTDETELSFNPLPRRFLSKKLRGELAWSTVAPASLEVERALGIPEMKRSVLSDLEEDGCPEGFARD